MYRKDFAAAALNYQKAAELNPLYGPAFSKAGDAFTFLGAAYGYHAAEAYWLAEQLGPRHDRRNHL